MEIWGYRQRLYVKEALNKSLFPPDTAVKFAPRSCKVGFVNQLAECVELAKRAECRGYPSRMMGFLRQPILQTSGLN
jgi:hypothetical protein